MTQNERQDLLDLIEGQEILSLYFEGCIIVKDGQIIRYGEIIDTDPSPSTIQALWEDLKRQEGLDAEFWREIAQEYSEFAQVGY